MIMADQLWESIKGYKSLRASFVLGQIQVKNLGVH